MAPDLTSPAVSLLQLDRLRLEGDAEVQSQRVTELQCVIAELSRKLERQRSAAIAEDEEEGASAASVQDLDADLTGLGSGALAGPIGPHLGVGGLCQC